MPSSSIVNGITNQCDITNMNMPHYVQISILVTRVLIYRLMQNHERFKIYLSDIKELVRREMTDSFPRQLLEAIKRSDGIPN